QRRAYPDPGRAGCDPRAARAGEQARAGDRRARPWWGGLRQARHHLLGKRKGTELPTFLADVIARMKPGDVSELMQTPSGFHIVKLNDTRTAGGPQIIQQVHLRHILLRTSEIEDDATVRQKLTHMRDQILSGKEDFAV